MSKTVLVTGGAGYIGSHCVLALLENGYEVVIFDNLSTGHIEIVESLKKNGHVTFVQGDLTEYSDIQSVFKNHKFDSVLHFAAFSQVGESVINPRKYYINNIFGTLNLLSLMLDYSITRIVFSSTAAIYGAPKSVSVDENHSQEPISPYGNTKLMIEKVLDDYDSAFGLKSVRLRYFNAAGADSLGRTGEWHDPETHLIPNILKSTFSGGKEFKMFGDDYPTKDGTCVRDYVNVEDLAKAHILALKYLENGGKTDCFNIGTKEGNSVKEVFDICKKVTGKDIAVTVEPRRFGDPAVLVADNTKAKNVLGWSPEKALAQSVQTAYNWEVSQHENQFLHK